MPTGDEEKRVGGTLTVFFGTSADREQGMSSKRRLMVAGPTMALMAGLGACGSGSGQNDNPWEDSTAGGGSGRRDEGHDDDQGTAPDTASEAATVTGPRDAVRHVSRKTTKVTCPHTVRKCTSPGRPSGVVAGPAGPLPGRSPVMSDSKWRPGSASSTWPTTPSRCFAEARQELAVSPFSARILLDDDGFELDITIVEGGPAADQLIRLTSDGCGSTCASACTSGPYANTASWRAWLQQAWEWADFATAVEAASPDLASRVDKVCAGRSLPTPAVRRTVLSVLRYLLRARTRATPFGLFAGVAAARMGAAPVVRMGTKHRASARPDAGGARLLCHRRRLRPWDAVQVGPLPHPMDAWSVEESFDDLFSDLAADLFGRLFRDLLDDFPEDVVHMLNPFGRPG
ncbi:FxLD family lanthipeptide [Streptomyces sp. NPDC059479]|uniref:FxLD family lanthipeptide n=1 Tax=Streptomyces sp. NPDC059479 TaxID=3346848 RepID=UPI0036A994A1